MRLWIYAIGHMRGTPEGMLCEEFCDRARKLGRNMGLSAVALEELAVSKHRDVAARMKDEAELARDLNCRGQLSNTRINQCQQQQQKVVEQRYPPQPRMRPGKRERNQAQREQKIEESGEDEFHYNKAFLVLCS